ncbi:MAG: hypothetical protein PQJ50_13380 [Spirochaetales bacterium]|nr:hypothetical protein [Spirochaetales bacterium]
MSSPQEDHRYKRRLITNAAVLFLLGALISLYLLFSPAEDYFQFYLDQSDKFLIQERYSDMEEQLLKASRHAKTRQQWFSLFKRSYMSAEAREDYSDFQGLVERSRRFLKGGADHEAINTAALLWTGQYEKASASLYSIQNEKYSSLIAETLLSYDVFRNYDLEGMTPLAFIKEKIRYQEDPDFFYSIGTKADNPVLLYNAALLSMEAGNTDLAGAIASGLPVNRISPYHLAVLFYDLGFYDRAFDSFTAQSLLDEMNSNQRFSVHQQIADIAFARGDQREALNQYAKAMTISPSGSWKNFRNMARIYFDQGYSNKARAVLREGIGIFPDSLPLLKDYVIYYHKDYPVEVRSELDAFMRTHPDLTEARLINMRYFPHQMSAVVYQAELWDLFNSDESNEAVTRFLLWYLSGINDADGMRIVLQRFKSGEEKPFWYHFYQSVIALNERDIDRAVKEIEICYSLKKDWIFSYNRAVLAQLKGNDTLALTYLEQASNELELRLNLFGREGYLSRISYERALILVEREDFDAAVSLLERAVALDGTNVRAAAVLNRIK